MDVAGLVNKNQVDDHGERVMLGIEQPKSDLAKDMFQPFSCAIFSLPSPRSGLDPPRKPEHLEIGSQVMICSG